MSEQTTYDVVAAGHICLDIIPSIPDSGARRLGDVLQPGKLLNVGDATVSTGGPVSNTGIALKLLGLRVAFLARVGDDEFGRLIRERLESHGSARGLRIAPGESTSYSVVIAAPGIDRVFLHNPGTNDTFTSRDVDFGLVGQARLFHLGYPPLMASLLSEGGRELVDIFREAKQRGVTTSLDTSLPDPDSPSGRVSWPDILAAVLPFVDVFLPSMEEALFMMNRDRFQEIKQKAEGDEMVAHLNAKEFSHLAGRFLDMGAKVVGLKAGHRGFYLRTATGERLLGMGAARPSTLEQWTIRELWCPSFQVDEIASTTGSGDAAIAGFLSALLRGAPPEKALAYANCVGYQNLHALDALGGIRSWEETVQLVDAGALEVARVEIDEAGWCWDTGSGVWRGPDDSAK